MAPDFVRGAAARSEGQAGNAPPEEACLKLNPY